MKVRVAREDIYIPHWNDNDKQDEKITISFSYMTPEQEEKLVQFKPKYAGDEIEIDFESKINATWLECVKKVDGLCDESGKPIISAAEVLKIPGIYGLITETVAHIKKGIEGEDLKNFK